ncbi:hypothetical protein YC2023_057036 [Brassica napus]
MEISHVAKDNIRESNFNSSFQYIYLQNLVNGFVFKGKPMIIQFGRNPGSAKPNE